MEENIPSLDELIFFEDDAIADFSEDPTTKDAPETGVDPTSIDMDEDDKVIDDGTSEEQDSEDEDNETIIDDESEDEDEDINVSTDAKKDEDGEDAVDEEPSREDSELDSYFNFLQDQGLLLLGENFEFDGTEEGFQKAVETTRSNMANQGAMMIWNQLPDDYKLVLEHGLSGGTDINAVKEIISGQTDLTQLDIEDEYNQEVILKDYFKRTTKYSDDRINRSISRLKASGDLEEEAETALNELKDIYKEEREELVKEQVKSKQEKEQRLQESYNNFTSVVEDMGLPESKRKRLVSSVWSVGDYGEYKDVSYFNYVDYMIKNNPEHLAQLAELYLDYDPGKGFKSDKAVKRAKTEVTRNFKDSIDKLSKTKSRTKSGKTRKPRSKTEDVEILEQLFNSK